MLRNDELRSLKGQVALTLGLFIGSLAIAISMILFRVEFENRSGEKHKVGLSDLPKELRKYVEKVAAQSDVDGLPNIATDADKESIYSAWIQSKELQTETFEKQFARREEAFLVARLEKTAVTGTMEQRRLAIGWIRKIDTQLSRDAISRLRSWAERRNRPDIVELLLLSFVITKGGL